MKAKLLKDELTSGTLVGESNLLHIPLLLNRKVTPQDRKGILMNVQTKSLSFSSQQARHLEVNQKT